MALLPALLLLLLALAALALALAAVLLGLPSYDIPPGVNQPAKLRLVLAVLLATAALGRILEKTGLCSQITFGRYVRQGRKLGVDPKLFIQDLQFNEVPVRVYQPKATSDGRRRGIIFFHGGGWVFGSLDTYEKVCRYISRESESVVVSVQYRLAPEHKYPAAYEDCLNATIHFMKNIEHYGVDSSNVIVCGDSAGGNLAAAVSQTLAGGSDLPKLRAQILIYPGLQALDFNLPSYHQNRGVPLLFRERAAFFALQYLNGHALHMQEVLEGSHIPPDMRLKYRKWFTKDTGKLGSSIYKTDFIWFPDHKPDQMLRRTVMEKFEGLPLQHFFTHHDEPRSRNLVSEYDDKYNRHGYNPVLLPLHSRNERKFAWIPKKADHPILGSFGHY
uniref:Alpha/beta hydrolase fold-3 domain-containing protein n=1 Tax=Otus sunia TaxID=257818 RepID=A0A8C8B2F8_9STRI